MEILKLLVRVIIFLLLIDTLTGCDSGWSVCGWEVK